MSDNSIQKIQDTLRKYRSYLAAEHLRNALLFALILGIVMLGLAITAESLWYLSGGTRRALLWIIGGVVAFIVFSAGLWVGLVGAGALPAYSDFSLAKRLGKVFPKIGDSVSNVLSLVRQSKSYGYSEDLTQAHIKSVARDIDGLELKPAVSDSTRKMLGKSFLGIVAFWILIWLPFHGSVLDGTARLFHPGTDYPVPKPFTFQITPGNQQILYTDPVTITVNVQGEQPDQVLLTSMQPREDETYVLTADSLGQYSHTFENVRQSFAYQVHAKSPHWWDRWGEIKSDKFNIQVLSRPQIQSLAIKLTPPKYSGLPQRQQEVTSTEIVALKGTEVALTAQTNKPVKSAALKFSSDDNPDSMSVEQTVIQSNFTMMKPDEFVIQLKDFQGITNSNPVTYRITPLPDEYPSVEIVQPAGEVDLGDNLVIPMLARLQDDYGFSKLAVEYQIIKPAAMNRDSTWKSMNLSLDDNSQTSVEYQHLWDLNSLNLSPRDQIKYRLALWDNDAISGPKVARSQTRMARFPSLADMFARNQQQQSEAIEQTEDIQNEIKQIKEQVDQLTTELRRKEEVTWQQQQQAESLVKSHDEVKKKLQEISKKLDEMIQQGQKHKLFSDEVMQKYQELQQLFQDLVTPELEQALKKLQEAMDKADPEEVRKAMENLQSREKDFSESIDRALELFKRVKIEQQMDEIVKRIDNLVKQQEDIAKKADSTSTDNQLLGQQQQKTADEFDITEKKMGEVADLMEDFPIMPSQEMRQAMEQAKSDSIGQQMRQAQQNFQQSNMQAGKQMAQQSKSNLEQLSKQLRNTQKQLQQQTMNEVMSEFRGVLRKVLALSQQQEQLQKKTRPLRGKSPVLGDLADEQQNLQMGLQHVVSDLVELSQKTFGVSRDIGKPIGQTASSMQKALQQLSDRRAPQAANSQADAMAALNETAQKILGSMNDLQSQGSSTGFQNYLQQMQQMSQQQQGINNQSQQLGMQGQPTLAQQAAMQRLAAQQMAVRKGLQQLLQEMKQGGGSQPMGDLGNVAKDMEDVAKDLKQSKFDRETMERQRKILSRMLDAQKSMRTRDYTKKRESESGEEVARSGPAGLPANFGERRNLLQEDLDQALQEGYSRNYEQVIRQYFEALSKAQETESVQKNETASEKE